ncbi:hypothetical protein J4412_00645 [Candidatus Pacearchaeota archaeon]|nr:MAG: hypothetical protein QJ16_C0006G0009 [archaeon GW2011_AR1]MBS3077998.1 hypothetical protein [Candidatus Pacearchaeota archaeon]HIH52213.1 hypothetical protein [Nanoarchaeota archaeon]
MNKKEIPKIFLRFGIGIVFLTFGIWQLINPTSWIGYVPGYVYGLGISILLIIILNGIFDLLIGISLISGIYLRFFSVFGIIRLLLIVFSLGWNEITVRDIGFIIVLIAIYLNEKDEFCFN